MEDRTFSIADLQKKLADIETEGNKLKKTINYLCELSGAPPLYSDADFELSHSTKVILKGDEYHGRPQATAVTEILESRKNRGLGPASLDELYDELIAGGHQFKGKSDQIQKRGLAIALSKNTKFYRLPNEKWGLSEWYPNVRKQKVLNNLQNEPIDGDESIPETDETEIPKEN